ncbi:MAG: Sec-independent protein translocase subunit TatA [Methylococcaceae bacterium]|nr:Sec-independent protein translocase subunit TatA [Methylococcaceae bacterium]
MGISVTQLLIILAIVIVLFGTKRLRNLGSDLGGAIKGFKSAVKEGEEDKKIPEEDANTIDSEVTSKQQEKSEK